MKFKEFLKLKDRKELYQPYVIAEAGVNHECDMETAKRLIREAFEGGADAIKFQTYKANTIASKNSPAYWDQSKEGTKSQYELFQKYDKFWKSEYKELKKYCDLIGIEFVSTPFDIESATFLNELMDFFKISSSDITNKPFIEYICKFGKPIILSTGASNLDEITEAISWIISFEVELVILHCILSYPTQDYDANLGMIWNLKENFPNYLIGYSDHTEPKEMKCLEIATLLGARIIEKHFTHDKKLLGNDHYHAMDKNDLKQYRKNIEEILKFFGSYHKYSTASELQARRNARRSLVLRKTLTEGSIIQIEDLTWKRPASGISPKEIDMVIGKKVNKTLTEDMILKIEDIE